MKAITNGTETYTGLLAVRPLWNWDEWPPEGFVEIEVPEEVTESTEVPNRTADEYSAALIRP